MNEPLEFFIPGTPAPGGSKTVFPIWKRDGTLLTKILNGRVWPIFNVTDDAGAGNKEWKKVCAGYARKFMIGTRPFTCALTVDFIFFLRRPNDHFIAGNRERGTLKPTAPPWHTGKPDALKFARPTEDALTGIVWADDSQTVRVSSEKRYCGANDQTGCIVRLVVLSTDQPQSPAVQKTLL